MAVWRQYHLRLVGYTAGIVCSLLVYSIMQERVMSVPFGKDAEVFKFSLFLVLANRILTFCVAATFLLVKKLDVRPAAPLHAYAAISASNVLATACQYEALRHVSFPVQTIGKSAKMIPAMVWGTLILRKTYRSREYALAFTMTVGCTLFLAAGEVTAKQVDRVVGSGIWGGILMTIYLASDGFTASFQSRLFKGYKMTVYNQILYTTAVSAAYSMTGLVTSGQLMGALHFVARHPESLTYILILSAASTSGQLFIVHTIKSFGPLTFAIIMTSRQFVSILLSCIIFAHPLSRGQWLGTLLVFGAISYKMVSSRTLPPNLEKVKFSEAKLESGGATEKRFQNQKPKDPKRKDRKLERTE